MGVIAQRKWAALRALHEEWGAPLALLDQTLERGEASVTSRAAKEGWVEGRTVGGLHARLMQVISTQMRQFETSTDTADEEKRTRALSVMAKTLESVAVTGSKLNTASGESQSPLNGRPDDIPQNPDAAGRQEIHRELARLVEGLGQSGGS